MTAFPGPLQFSCRRRVTRATLLTAFAAFLVPAQGFAGAVFGADAAPALDAGGGAGSETLTPAATAPAPTPAARETSPTSTKPPTPLGQTQSRHDGFFFRLGFGVGRSYLFWPHRTAVDFTWAFETLLGASLSPYVDLGLAVFADPAMDGSSSKAPVRAGFFGAFRLDAEGALNFLGSVAMGSLSGYSGLFGVLGAGYDVPISARLSVGFGARFEYGWVGYLEHPGEASNGLRAGVSYTSPEVPVERTLGILTPRLLITLSHP